MLNRLLFKDESRHGYSSTLSGGDGGRNSSFGTLDPSELIETYERQRKV